MTVSSGRFVQNAVLMTLDAGDANAEYGGPLSITNLSTSITIDAGMGAGTYTSFPEFQVKLPDRSGGFEEKELTVEISIEDSTLLARIINGYPFAPVKVDVYEYIFNDVTGAEPEIKHLYRGKIAAATNNVNKMRDVIRVTVTNDKSRMNFPLGMTANVQCDWTLGDNNCQATVVPYVGEVESVQSTVMVLTAAPNPGTYPSRLFNKGFVERNGIRILIKEWISGEVFYLAKPVPPEWVGEDVTVNSGCDRALQTCVGIYDNQPRFLGLGYLMSAHNPIYEEP